METIRKECKLFIMDVKKKSTTNYIQRLRQMCVGTNYIPGPSGLIELGSHLSSLSLKIQMCSGST